MFVCVHVIRCNTEELSVEVTTLATRMAQSQQGPLFGFVEPFDKTNDECELYVERLEQYFSANGITDTDKKGAIFLSVCSRKTYRLVRDLVSLEKPSEKNLRGALHGIG